LVYGGSARAVLVCECVVQLQVRERERWSIINLHMWADECVTDADCELNSAWFI
jgi:hypothetical protein